MTDSITAEIANFTAALRFEDLPPSVIDGGTMHILDTVGLALAGRRSEAVHALEAHLDALAVGNAEATIWGASARTAPRFAALLNGTAAHADNFDDTNPQADPARNGGIHATAPALAAALAVAETTGATGPDLLAALHAGIEIVCKLSHAIHADHYASGFHTTGTLTTFGAALAAGKLLHLDAKGLEIALGFAASLTGGLRRNFGTDAEILHPGLSAENGIVAAEMAAAGLTAAGAALEGRLGYFDAAGRGADLSVISGRLGNPWAFVDPGMWIKPFPCGALTHPAMTLLREMKRKMPFEATDIARIRVRTNERLRGILGQDLPRTVAEARFSMEFCVAAIAADGDVGLATFTDEALARSDIAELMRKIAFTAYDTAEDTYTNVTTLIDIELSDGATRTGRADHAIGSTARPMTFDDVVTKFTACAELAGVASDRQAAVVSAVQNLASARDLQTLTEALQLP